MIQIPAFTVYFEKNICHGQVKEHKKIPHGQVPPASSQSVGKPDYFLWDGILIALSSVCSCSTIGRPNIDLSYNHILTIGINNSKIMSILLVFPKKGKFRICFYWILISDLKRKMLVVYFHICLKMVKIHPNRQSW